MMATGFIIAAVISGIAFVVHAFSGTKLVKGPLFEGVAEEQPRLTLFLVWRCATIILGVVSVGFLWAALSPDAWEVGAIAVVMTGACGLWGACLQISSRVKFFKPPQWVGFLAIAVAGASSLVGAAS